MRVAKIRELPGKDTFVVKNSGLYPVVSVESGQVSAVGLAGARLLTETSGVTGLGNELSRRPCLRGGGRGRCATRARSFWIWWCAWPWEAWTAGCFSDRSTTSLRVILMLLLMAEVCSWLSWLRHQHSLKSKPPSYLALPYTH